MTSIYNSLDGIATYLTDLEGLNRLAADRRAAAKSGERLDAFCVLGRWYLEERGSISPLGTKNDKAPADLGECPSVMTVEQLQFFMRDDMLVRTSAWPFPPAYVTCTACGEKWTIRNARDFDYREESEETPIEQFVGQPLNSVTEIASLLQVKKHFVMHDMIYNDRHPEGAETRTARNGNLWRYVDKDYVVQTGDRAAVQVVKFTHRACQQKARELETRAEFEQAFAEAGYPKVNLVTRPNGYCPCDTCTPWYSAQVAGSHPFIVGWRKRVINVNWEESGVQIPTQLLSEQVTQGNSFIHAHGYAKLTEYLKILLPALGAVAQ